MKNNNKVSKGLIGLSLPPPLLLININQAGKVLICAYFHVNML